MNPDIPENEVPQYFYRYEREGHVIKKIYVGAMSDPVVALLSRSDRLRKAMKTGRFEIRNSQSSEYEEIERDLTLRK